MSKTRKCPACGREIFMHAQVCPYCKAETHFTSIDEEPQPEDIDEEATISEPDDVEEQSTTDGQEEGKLGKYIGHLKKDKEKVKEEYQKKIKSKYSGSTILIVSVIFLLSLIVLGLYIAVRSMEQKTFSLSGTVDNTMKEVLDSVESKLYQSSTIVAKFPDREKHCMYYLQDSHLFVYDAKNNTNKEINLPELNAKAIVDFNGSGVLNAYLSTNKKYVIIIASRNAANTEFGLYRLGTDPDNLMLEYIDKGRVMPEKDGYTVKTNMRMANYDANGDKVSGISGTEWDNMPKTQVDNAPKMNTQEHKSVKPKLPSREAVSEEVRRSADIHIDIDPPSQPQKPELP